VKSVGTRRYSYAPSIVRSGASKLILFVIRRSDYAEIVNVPIHQLVDFEAGT
jgi:hypothetical protein